MMEMEKVFEMSDTNSIFTQLVACEHSILYTCRGQIVAFIWIYKVEFLQNVIRVYFENWCAVCYCVILCYSLEQEASKCATSGNTERHRELAEKLKQQHEILEAERKVCYSISCSYFFAHLP
jgi:hypothetical protein